MKRYILSAAALLGALIVALPVSGQMRTSYFLNGSTQRYDLNPALSPQRGYLSIPVAGSLYTNVETNFLSAENFFYPNGQNNGVVTYMHKSVSAEEFLAKLPDQNAIEFGINDQILGIGNYFKGGFWSVGLRLRSESNVNIPKDFFAITKTLSQGSYDISGMGIESNNFVEASLGYTFPVQDVFTLGIRAKVLLGLAHMRATIDKLQVEVGEESYTAEMAGSFEANITGYDFSQMGQNEITLGSFVDHITNFDNFNPANIKSIGFAVDAGIEWTFRDEQIRLSAAVNDLGFNAWNANNSFCAMVDNMNFSFSGYDFQNNEVKFESPEKIELLPTDAVNEGRTALHTSFVVGLEYNFFNDIVGIGALWNMKRYETRKWNSIGGALTIRPFAWLSASANYSLVNSLGVMGMALNIHSSLANIFVGADYIASKFGTANGGAIPVPLNQNSVNITFGVSIPLGVRMF